MSQQQEGNYKIPTIEVSREQHRFLKVAAIFADMSMVDFVKAKVFEGMPPDFQERMASVLGGEPESRPAPTEAPEAPAKRRGRPPGVKNGQGRGRTKADRKSPKPPPVQTYTMAGDGGWQDEPAPSATPVTDSLTADERERLIAKLTEDEGYEDDESDYEDDHGVEEVDFED